MSDMTGVPQIAKSQPLPMASVRVQSSSTLAQALRGDATEDAKAAIYERAHVCLASFFDPDQDPGVKAQVRAGFVKALSDLPLWAVLAGFDRWNKTSTRRPAPAEIRMLAEAELRPITDELARRKRIEEEQQAEEAHRQRTRVAPEVAEKILQEAGFTTERSQAVKRFPMAGSSQQAMTAAKEVDAPPAPRVRSEAELRQLEAARAANPIICEARDRAARIAAQPPFPGQETA